MTGFKTSRRGSKFDDSKLTRSPYLSALIERQLISLPQHGEETGAQKEGLKTMLEEVEFLTGPDLLHQGKLEVVPSPCH